MTRINNDYPESVEFYITLGKKKKEVELAIHNGTFGSDSKTLTAFGRRTAWWFASRAHNTVESIIHDLNNPRLITKSK
jgi:hypothetical protein